MKMKVKILTTMGLALLLLVPSEGFASGGGGSPPPDKGGDSGMGGGNSNPGTVKGDTFGDLYVIVRDGNGVPIHFSWDWTDAENPVPTQKNAEAGFVQPIALTSNQWEAAEIEGDWDLPGTCYSEDFKVWLVPMNDEGEVHEDYAEYTQEVELGRLNLARAPEAVLDAAYQEALNAINSATNITIDPCGRLLMIIDGEEKTIDSPRENLALYKKMMTVGYLPGMPELDEEHELFFLTEPQLNSNDVLSNPALDQAASFLAAAGDKGTEITVDEVIYLNNTLGINLIQSNAGKEDEYFNFWSYTYSSDERTDWYDAGAELLLGPISMIFLDDDHPGDWAVAYYVGTTNILDVVSFAPSVLDNQIGVKAFAAATSDALAVLTYIHDRAVPEVGVD